MRVRIYQINMERDRHGVCFLGYENAVKFSGRIDPKIYDLRLDADLDTTDLEEIYRRFNMEKHPQYRGRSMSTSDVVVVGDDAYYCDTVGFKKIDFNEVP